MSQLIHINEKSFPLLTYQEQPVVTFSMIDEVHERPRGTARRNFFQHQPQLIEGEDFYHLSYASVESLYEFRIAGIMPNSQGLTVLTESGYLMLVKSFQDDLAWTVQRQLVHAYFRTPRQPASPHLHNPRYQHLIDAVSQLDQDEHAAMQAQAVAFQSRQRVAQLLADLHTGPSPRPPRLSTPADPHDAIAHAEQRIVASLQRYGRMTVRQLRQFTKLPQTTIAERVACMTQAATLVAYPNTRTVRYGLAGEKETA